MLARSGESGPPCGVPPGLDCKTPSTITPARRLPSHPGSPQSSCPHLVLCQSEGSLGLLISFRLPISHRGLAPHTITLVTGVHQALEPTRDSVQRCGWAGWLRTAQCSRSPLIARHAGTCRWKGLLPRLPPSGSASRHKAATNSEPTGSRNKMDASRRGKPTVRSRSPDRGSPGLSRVSVRLSRGRSDLHAGKARGSMYGCPLISWRSHDRRCDSRVIQPQAV